MHLWQGAPDSGTRSFWQSRFYDFNVWSKKKRIEKLNYMHMNPVKRGLVTDPKLWPWSSYRFYQYGEKNACKPDREPK
jgi:putative transposase